MTKFLNYLGEPVSLTPPPKTRKPSTKQGPDEFHKGFRVVGVPPGALKEAKDEHKRLQPAKTWDEAQWLMNARRKAVRVKPYEIRDAAMECAELAERSGWLNVEVLEVKMEAANRASNTGGTFQ